MSDLKFIKDDLLKLEIIRRAYKFTLTPLISLAASQGFMANWSYSIDI